MKSLYGTVGPQLLPEETSIRLEGGRATQWKEGGIPSYALLRNSTTARAREVQSIL